MDSKPFYKSKILWINFLVIVAALISYVVGGEFPVPLPEATTEFLLALLGIINIVLRLWTNQAVTIKP